MSEAQEILQAARARAAALAAGDASRLTALLHPGFRWTSHTGESFDKDAYVHSNTGGRTVWREQHLDDAEVTVVDGAAVLRAVVTDVIETPNGPESHRMPMTQLWVRTGGGWQCLAGHAGPRVDA